MSAIHADVDNIYWQVKITGRGCVMKVIYAETAFGTPNGDHSVEVDVQNWWPAKISYTVLVLFYYNADYDISRFNSRGPNLHTSTGI